jgi:hypothetical protein
MIGRNVWWAKNDLLVSENLVAFARHGALSFANILVEKS